MILHTSAYEDGTSETSAIINQTPGNYPKGNLLYSVQGESLKSRIVLLCHTTGWPPLSE